MAYRELMIGAGSTALRKQVSFKAREEFANPTTLDINPDHKPDVVWDLMKLPTPFEDNSFDEIHAYDVLSHTGAQGDWRFFFAQWSDFWRILKPEGIFFGKVPALTSRWVWGDPSHSRVITKDNFVFLDQSAYTEQVGKSSFSDYRFVYKADFQTASIQESETHLAFVLRAVKPSRIKEG